MTMEFRITKIDGSYTLSHRTLRAGESSEWVDEGLFRSLYIVALRIIESMKKMLP